MDITTLIENLPTDVKGSVIDFEDVQLKNPKKDAIRVTLSRLLTDDEKAFMKRNKKIVGVDCVCQYRYAPEIKKSYFYVLY